jgi:type VI secretion system secreted protein Hcp
MRRLLVLLLLGALATLGLTACMSDDENESAASAQNRRSAALVDTSVTSPGGYLITIDPITGPDQAIVADAFSWGLSNGATAQAVLSGAGAGKVQVQDFHITKSLDQVSPLLFKAASVGTHSPKAILTISQGTAGAKPYATYTLEDVLISSYQVSGANPNTPNEQLTLSFAKMTIESSSPGGEKESEKGAPQTATWDLRATQ